MSEAGTLAQQGFEYQLQVAIGWVIRLLDPSAGIDYVQVESTGVPDEDFEVDVDDIVVHFNDGRYCFIQAKKNQVDYGPWSLSDKTIQDELKKAKQQLTSNPGANIQFYSKSTFGEVQKLSERCLLYPDLESFLRSAPCTSRSLLEKVARLTDCDLETTFKLCRSLSFETTPSAEDLEAKHCREIHGLATPPRKAFAVIEKLTRKHTTKDRGAPTILRADNLREALQKEGIIAVPKLDMASVREEFRTASRIGRSVVRTIGGRKLHRGEAEELAGQLNGSTLLVCGKAGSGKTCVMLDLVESIESCNDWAVLFIKGDRFCDVADEEQLAQRGMPKNVVGKCARLAESQHVLLAIDSLDVLSIARDHTALKVFLGIIERLAPVAGISVVVACRHFDLKYDPLLQGTKWSRTIDVGQFDWGEVVAPFLQNVLGMNPETVPTQVRELICLPQNLAMYEKILSQGHEPDVSTDYELAKLAVDTLILHDDLLGEEAVDRLAEFADRRITSRQMFLPERALRLSEQKSRRVLSHGILIQVEEGLGFMHQTIADSLVVRKAEAEGVSLADFILRFPSLPFIRPTVRVFALHLRGYNTSAFRRQIWGAIDSPRVPYHVKRLLVESFAGMTPERGDTRFILRLFGEYPKLFRRFLRQAEDPNWFPILSKHWLPLVKSPPVDAIWLIQFSSQTQQWVNDFPDEIVRLFRDLLELRLDCAPRLCWLMILALRKFQHWDTEGLSLLLERLFELDRDEHSTLGEVLSRRLAATGAGDDLLWRYITSKVSLQETSGFRLGDTLRCRPHEFYTKDFLQRRLTSSEKLLDLAIADVESWARHFAGQWADPKLVDTFLNKTSWREIHTDRENLHVDGLTVLFNGMEQALRHHALENSLWWQANEPNLRRSSIMVYRYFLVLAYAQNIKSNVAGISHLLTDDIFLQRTRFVHELGELVHDAYPYLSDAVKTVHQQRVLTLHADHEEQMPSYDRGILSERYQHAIHVPSIYRQPALQTLVENLQTETGNWPAAPQKYAWSGTHRSPVGSAQIKSLSCSGRVALLQHFGHLDPHDSDFPSIWHDQGLDMFHLELKRSSAESPEEFLNLIPDLRAPGNRLMEKFIESVVDGVSDHIRFRFGNLQPGNPWVPDKPLPDGPKLARRLLPLPITHPHLRDCTGTVRNLIEACCWVLLDAESSEPLLIELFCLQRSPSPGKPEDSVDYLEKKNENLVGVSINSDRGVAAGSAMVLANRLIEAGQPLHALVHPLLIRFAHDSSMAVRISILRRLPCLLRHQPELGWELLDATLHDAQPELWPHAERCFYVSYREHFDRVKPYLDLLSENEEVMVVAGETWGRIMSLAMLEGHIKLDGLLNRMQSLESIPVWKGAATVFAANVMHNECREPCVRGLLTLLEQEDINGDLFQAVEECFEGDKTATVIPVEVAHEILRAYNPKRGRELYHLLKWLEALASHDPLAVIPLLEKLSGRIEEGGNDIGINLWPSEPVVSALVEILREADERDDESLITRVIRLQDCFLMLGVRGMEEMLDNASSLD